MSNAVNHWIAEYGILGVFLAAAIEGELGVLVGGAMAHLGKLNPIYVGLAAWIAAFLSAQAFFHAGRSQRDSKWIRRLTDQPAFSSAIKWLDRNPTLFCLLYRFVYGMRVVGPVAISQSQIEARTYTIFNFFTALGWATAGVSLGWMFGLGLAHWQLRCLTPKLVTVAIVAAMSILVGVTAWRARVARRRKG